jgi:uncharacterized membrane protein
VGKKHISLIGVSAMGAFGSNFVQILFSRFFIFGEAAWYIAPVFLGIGLISSIILGGLGNYYCEHSQWFKTVILERNSNKYG